MLPDAQACGTMYTRNTKLRSMTGEEMVSADSTRISCAVLLTARNLSCITQHVLTLAWPVPVRHSP